MELEKLPAMIKFNPENYDMAEYPMAYDPDTYQYRYVNDLGIVVQPVDTEFFLDHPRYFIIIEN